MFKSVMDDVWAFDAEWVPDPVAGRLVPGLPHDMPDREVILQSICACSQGDRICPESCSGPS